MQAISNQRLLQIKNCRLAWNKQVQRDKYLRVRFSRNVAGHASNISFAVSVIQILFIAIATQVFEDWQRGELDGRVLIDLPFSTPVSLIVFLIACSLLTSIFFHVLLNQSIIEWKRFTVRAQCIGLLIGALPFWFFYVSFWWLRILDQKPGWAMKNRDRSIDTAKPSLRTEVIRNCRYSMNPFFINSALYILAILSVFLWYCALQNVAHFLMRADPAQFPIIRIVLLSIYTVSALVLVSTLHRYATRQRLSPIHHTIIWLGLAFVLWPNSFIVQVPPLMLVAIFSCLPLIPSFLNQETMVSNTFSNRESETGFSVWEPSLSHFYKPSLWPKQFRRNPRQSRGVVQKKRTWLVRLFAVLKIMLLFPEFIWLGVFTLGTVQERNPIAIIILLFTILFMGAIVIGCFSMVVAYLKRIRWPEKYQDLPIPSGWLPFGVATLAAFSAGIFAGGQPLASGWVWQVTAGYSSACLMILVPRFFVGIIYPEPTFMKEDDNFLITMAGGMVFFVWLAVNFGGQTHLTELAIMLYPLVFLLGPLLGLTLGGWLIKPGSWSAVMDQNLALSKRLQLALLAATVFLPFGGIAAPWWIARYNKLSLKPKPGSRNAS